MRSLTSQKPTPSAFNSSRSEPSGPEPVRGAYQPVGKVDIAAIRAQAKQSGEVRDERPEIVKGSYEPIGKVDIAAIRARAQPSSGTIAPAPSRVSPAATGGSEDTPTRSLADRSFAFSSGPERLTSLPKPKVGNKFGGGSTFTGTRAPLPGAAAAAPTAPVGVASRTFADEGGKTPAQIWAEKKARERGQSGSGDALSSTNTGPSVMTAQTSGGGEWKSGYAGKSWAPVQTTYTGKSAGSSSVGQQRTGELQTQEEQEEEAPASPAGGISSIRDRFSGAAPMGAPAPASAFDRAAPEPDISNKPNRGIPIPGLPQESSGLPIPPPQPPRSPTPPTPEMRDTSPIRIAQPVGRGAIEDAHEEQMSPPPIMPVRSIPHADEDDEPETGPDPARAAAQSTAAATMGQAAVDAAPAVTHGGAGERAKADYDYEAAEENEVSLREGEIVTNVEKIDPDWWVVTNEKGQNGLVPANYLSALEGDEEEVGTAPIAAHEAPPAEEEHQHEAVGAKATAQYDYEAAEDNELSFPENATITNVVCIAHWSRIARGECSLTCLQTFPDDDWWHGEFEGRSGLFPSNYVELKQ